MYIFVTGTDTEVGKSYVCRGICEELAKRGETTGYLKPFQSGVTCDIPIDADIVNEKKKFISHSSYITKTPATPLISAEMDNVEFNLKKVTADFEHLKKTCENVIVEGSGGIYAPVSKGILMADVIKMLKIPAIVVARPNLGTINHTLMTIECLTNNNIRVLGTVISNCPRVTNDPNILRAKEMIEMFSGNVKVLDVIEENGKDFSNLTSEIMEAVCAGAY